MPNRLQLATQGCPLVGLTLPRPFPPIGGLSLRKQFHSGCRCAAHRENVVDDWRLGLHLTPWAICLSRNSRITFNLLSLPRSTASIGAPINVEYINAPSMGGDRCDNQETRPAAAPNAASSTPNQRNFR